jgi:DNA invertase Pin-like site-specific DNA recombinase
LVVAKLDGLTRSVAFLSRLLDAAVDVRFVNLPMIEGATGKILLQQMSAVAELEARLISARTKAALAAAKRRGVKLGGESRRSPDCQAACSRAGCPDRSGAETGCRACANHRRAPCGRM